MHRALFQADNAYNIEHLGAKGHCCKTNLQSNTAFRGFGGPQSMLVAETWIEQVFLSVVNMQKLAFIWKLKSLLILIKPIMNLMDHFISFGYLLLNMSKGQ